MNCELVTCNRSYAKSSSRKTNRRNNINCIVLLNWKAYRVIRQDAHLAAMTVSQFDLASAHYPNKRQFHFNIYINLP